MHQAVLLVPAVLRGLPRAQLTVAAGAAVALVWLLPGQLGDGGIVVALQYAALALSVGLAAVLDEPGGETVRAVPPPLAMRRAVTLAVVLSVLAAAWAGLVWIGDVHGGLAGGLTLQLTALALLTLALGACWTRGRAAAGPLVAVAFLCAGAAAPDWALRPDFGESRWVAIWAAVAVGALVALLLATRDPAGRTGKPRGGGSP